ncbi:MAG TPA: Gfo/Idh/MocA family oxidoreductase [Isosphaeraceae bacterium]|jgi:predicted dehydrogenase|nr:Gfo/Idh/MocA family oxidoreductase [Isosphaeraceae bacterium]
MPPIRLNRRRFIGCSAAAGWALSQGMAVEGVEGTTPVRVGLIGLGNRGTSLLRTLLELTGAPVTVVCDLEPRHRLRAQGICEKAGKPRPEAIERVQQVLERTDVDAVVVALPCDLHAGVYTQAIRAGKHLYAEKPLGLTLAECDTLIVEAGRAPEITVHTGFQRRSNPRYCEGVALAHRGELGELLEARAAWVSSNGPVNGYGNWLADRERSGDWMVEQAVHVWDLLAWLAFGPPTSAVGHGRRDLFAHVQPNRDVTDHYAVSLEWPSGFHASFVHSWIDPADDAFTGVSQRLIGTAGGLDFSTGVATFRDRTKPRLSLHPGPQPDTRLALQAFLDSIRSERHTTAPVSLAEARDATLTGLLVRKAVDERRVVMIDEIRSSG